MQAGRSTKGVTVPCNQSCVTCYMPHCRANWDACRRSWPAQAMLKQRWKCRLVGIGNEQTCFKCTSALWMRYSDSTDLTAAGRQGKREGADR